MLTSALANLSTHAENGRTIQSDALPVELATRHR